MSNREEIINFLDSTGNWDISGRDSSHVIANSINDSNLMIELNTNTAQIYSLSGVGPASIRVCYGDIDISDGKFRIPSLSSVVAEINL